MRDHLRLRSRIAILAGLAGVPLTSGCNPPPKPEKTDAVPKRTADRSPAGADAADGPAQAKRPLSPTRLKYYQDKAREQGVPLADVVPDHFELPEDAKGPQVRQRPDKIKTVSDNKLTPPDVDDDDDDDDDAKAGEAAADDDDGDDDDDAARPPTTSLAQAHVEDAGALIGFPGDPPFIDGYNPEEAPCPSGNWCGDKAAAGVVGVLDAGEQTLGCAPKIVGARGKDQPPIVGKAYEGLSTKQNMQGSFNEHGTELARAAKGTDDICCYHWFEYCSGRPHLGAEGPVVAETVSAGLGAWGDAVAVRAPVDAELRARLADGWRDDALAEHASIASFARATIELMAVGAPADLLARCQRAGLDEVEHARRCFALASAYAGAPIAPGPLPALAPRDSDPIRLAVDTFAEGCVGETIAALVAERSGRDCTDPLVAETLATIADDETRHAALAWATLRWAVATGGDPIREALRRRADAIRPPQRPAPAGDPQAAALAAHGRLDARAHDQAVRDAWREIVDPLLRTLLA